MSTQLRQSGIRFGDEFDEEDDWEDEDGEELDDDAARVVRMFRLCTGRTPAAREVAILTRALADFVARYRDDAVNGRYELLIQNVGGRGEGELRGFSLEITSRWD